MAHVVSVAGVAEAPSEDVWALIEDISQRALWDLNWRLEAQERGSHPRAQRPEHFRDRNLLSQPLRSTPKEHFDGL
jgi:hypothetical protein